MGKTVEHRYYNYYYELRLSSLEYPVGIECFIMEVSRISEGPALT